MVKLPAGGSLLVGGKHQFPANADPMANGKEFLRVDGFVTKPDFIMEMGTVNTAGAPHFADHCACSVFGSNVIFAPGSVSLKVKSLASCLMRMCS